MCFTPKIKLRNLRWVPNSIATQLPSAHGAGLTHCPIGHLWRAVSQGSSAVLTALSKEKVAQTFVALSVRREQERKLGWNTARQREILKVALYHCHLHTKELQSHVDTLAHTAKRLHAKLMERNERRDGTGSIPQGNHLPRMPNLRHLSGHTSVNPPAPWGSRPVGCRGCLPPPISAHLSTCVDADQGHSRHRET